MPPNAYAAVKHGDRAGSLLGTRMAQIALLFARSRRLMNIRRRLMFSGSGAYWERRYRRGGDSGAGSAGRLAVFKADTINAFVAEHGVRSIIEFGCGDGQQLLLARYPAYVGIDISAAAVAACRQRFIGDPTKTFHITNALPPGLGLFDAALSIDVIYHLVEDEVFEAYMACLFAHARRYVMIYSSNMQAKAEAPHIRHRIFKDWIERNAPGWRQTAVIPNRYPLRYDGLTPDFRACSFADFYIFEPRPPTA
jgi:SAM-dependent methyltransferase